MYYRGACPHPRGITVNSVPLPRIYRGFPVVPIPMQLPILQSLHKSTCVSQHPQLTTQQLLLQPLYGPLPGTTRVSWYQKKHSPTHLSWSSSNLYQLLPSTTFHSILPVQITCLTIFCTTSLQVLFGLPLGLDHHTPYISSPNQCLLFAAHAHTIAACFAVVPRLYHLFLVSLWKIFFEQSFTARIPLLTTATAFGLRRRCQSSPQLCYLHHLCTT